MPHRSSADTRPIQARPIKAHSIQAIVVGCSAGGLEALRAILPHLPPGFPIPIIVVAHTGSDAEHLLADLLERATPLPVAVAMDKDPIVPGCVYLAPTGYHLLIEPDHSFALSIDPKVCNVRPAADVLFESAADVYGPGLAAVVLTGSNADGAAGLAAVRRAGGLGIVQTPATAAWPEMPRSALTRAGADHILPLDRIGPFLSTLA